MVMKEFKSESKRLLDLMINSIYTHREIFLRELISNASDAIDKIYYKSLSDDNINFNKEDFFIKVSIDKENRTIKISDTGIGMSKEELTLALNEIYARHGLMFNTSSIQEHFNSKSWYVPSIKPGHFDDSQFNDYERYNVDTIVNYMEEKGYR